MTMHAALVIALILVVVALFALALIEASLLHVRRSEVVVHAQSGDHQARRLLALVDDLPRVMNAVLLAVLLCQVTATAIAGVLARNWLGGTGITVATVAVVVVLFVYGEAIPKTLAIRHPYAFARRLSAPIRWLNLAFRPFVSVLVMIADAQSPGLTTDTVTAVSEKELLHLTGESAMAGRIEEADAELIERSFILGDLSVGEIMVPRAAITAVADDTPVDEALRRAIAVGHRRLPVFRDGIEHIIGFARLRDLAEAATAGSGDTIATLVQPSLSVPASMRVIDLLRSMQSSGNHLAVVVDPDGRTEGIATIEDAVEDLVGTIADQR
jgi:CBS domain containing-hemolysin-like protein